MCIRDSLVAYVGADDRVRAQILCTLRHLVQDLFARLGHFVLVARRAPAKDVAKPRADVAEHVDAAHGLPGDDAQILNDLVAIETVGGGNGEHCVSFPDGIAALCSHGRHVRALASTGGTTWTMAVRPYRCCSAYTHSCGY